MVEVLGSLHPLADKLAAEPIESAEAAELVQLCVQAERVVVAMRMMAARAVDSDHWQARGFRSAAAWMAAEAGTPTYRGGPGTWEWIAPERPTDAPPAGHLMAGARGS